MFFAGVAEVESASSRLVCPSPVSARTRGPFHLTLDTNDVIETAHEFADAVIVPVHHDGWAHFTPDGGRSHQDFLARSRLRAALAVARAGVATTIDY